jgi:hypothetical protein
MAIKNRLLRSGLSQEDVQDLVNALGPQNFYVYNNNKKKEVIHLPAEGRPTWRGYTLPSALIEMNVHGEYSFYLSHVGEKPFERDHNLLEAIVQRTLSSN